MPRDADRLARGEQIVSNTGQLVKLSRPLDVDMIAAFAQGTISPALNYQPGNPASARVWDDIITAAEDFNDPGVFTTFEWTSLVQGNNLHRNVIFGDGPEKAGQVVPYTATPPIGSPNPRDLWAWMATCEAETGGRVLAVPHNGTLSNGCMFPLRDDFAEGAPLYAAYAEARQRWEPLCEATQIKGDGEAHPALSPEDEFADFDTFDYGNLDRIQIVKVWLDANGGQQEKIYDVAWSDGREPGADGKLPPVGSAVDLSIPSWTDTIGAAELGPVWNDPDFDPRSAPSITPASSRSRRPAGPPTTGSSSTSTCRATSGSRPRSAPTPRRSGTRPKAEV